MILYKQSNLNGIFLKIKFYRTKRDLRSSGYVEERMLAYICQLLKRFF
jgi:hypothetical protein